MMALYSFQMLGISNPTTSACQPRRHESWITCNIRNALC